LTIILAIAGTIGQKIGEKCTGLRLLQPVRLKSDRLLGHIQINLMAGSIIALDRYNFLAQTGCKFA
jgi:hypothetical protein